jgi:hypothetical protein
MAEGACFEQAETLGREVAIHGNQDRQQYAPQRTVQHLPIVVHVIFGVSM